jgi:hypothetical protein
MRMDRTQVHVLTIALLGKTADHLRYGHAITPAGDWRQNPESKRANGAAHLGAHREADRTEGP